MILKSLIEKIFSIFNYNKNSIPENHKNILPEEEVTEHAFNPLTTKLTLTPTQNEIIDFLTHSGPVVGVEAPTGTGKTVIYLKFAEQWQGKIIVSSFTKGLQHQIVDEIQKFFPDLTYTVLKGKGNYICQDKLSTLPPEEASLLSQVKPPISVLNKVKVTSKYCRPNYQCDYKPSCQYMQTVEKAKHSKIIIVNHFLLDVVTARFSEKNLLLIVDECHEIDKLSNKAINFPPELFPNGVLTVPEEPKIENYKSKQEFNLAVERFLTLQELYNLALELKVDKPCEIKTKTPFKNYNGSASKVVYISATFPLELKPEDFYTTADHRSWKDITFQVLNTNYKNSNYNRKLFATIRKCIEEYPKTLILCCSHDAVSAICKNIPEVKTARSSVAINNLLLDPNVKAVASTAIWKGVNYTGEKAVIITKLPFDPIGEHEDYPTAVAKMVQKFAQGCGRMKRSSQCEGEIFILDNRIINYPEAMEYIRDKEKNDAEIIFENNFHIKANNGNESKSEVVQFKHKKTMNGY